MLSVLLIKRQLINVLPEGNDNARSRTQSTTSQSPGFHFVPGQRRTSFDKDHTGSGAVARKEKSDHSAGLLDLDDAEEFAFRVCHDHEILTFLW